MIEHRLLESINKLKRQLDNMRGATCGEWMGMKDVICYTGLSASTIRRAITRGHLKVSKNLGKLMFRRDWVDRWIGG